MVVTERDGHTATRINEAVSDVRHIGSEWYPTLDGAVAAGCNIIFLVRGKQFEDAKPTTE